ncbi:MAG: CocE/NonD family hydrolase [Pseudomonadota bacterium]
MPAKKQKYPVEACEHQWVPMPDGVRLSARIWQPRRRDPSPAILEIIPYRKRDMVRARDKRNHPYFAAQGYVCLRVDMRGSGESEGHMPDMYSAAELSDTRHVIAWIAAQPWCDGKVGMFGTSWGGTASLQAAVDAPGPLKAVIANCATADRFEDDIHWMGGCVLSDTLEWGATLPAILAAPPDARTVGPGWRAQWQDRLAGLHFPLQHWLENRSRNAYWRHGSVLEQADRLTVPILAIGGWADRYANTVMRLSDARPDLVWGVVGPWGHHYPDVGEPGPAMGFQDLSLAWWDHCLKDAPRPDWPKLRVWQRCFDPPQDRLATRAGGWVAVGGRTDAATLHLGDAGLRFRPERGGVYRIPNDLRHGQAAGDTGYFGRVGGLPLDQTPDDARCLCFDSAPLTSAINLIGAAELVLPLVRDKAQAQLVARICDVAPDGRSNLVARHIVNLALSETRDDRAGFTPDAIQTMCLTFPTMAYRFAPGHRLRVALGTSYWPLVWPSPEPAQIGLHGQNARLVLPSRRLDTAPALPEAHPLPLEPSWTTEATGPLQRRPEPDDTGATGWQQPAVTTRFANPELGITTAMRMTYRLGAGEEPRCDAAFSLEISRPDGVARIDTDLTALGSAEGLQVDMTLIAVWDDDIVARRHWRAAQGGEPCQKDDA